MGSACREPRQSVLQVVDTSSLGDKATLPEHVWEGWRYAAHMWLDTAKRSKKPVIPNAKHSGPETVPMAMLHYLLQKAPGDLKLQQDVTSLMTELQSMTCNARSNVEMLELDADDAGSLQKQLRSNSSEVGEHLCSAAHLCAACLYWDHPLTKPCLLLLPMVFSLACRCRPAVDFFWLAPVTLTLHNSINFYSC